MGTHVHTIHLLRQCRCSYPGCYRGHEQGGLLQGGSKSSSGSSKLALDALLYLAIPQLRRGRVLKVFQELHLGELSTWGDEEELRVLSELWRGSKCRLSLAELCAVRLFLGNGGGKNLLGNGESVDGLGVVRLSWMDGA